MIWTFTTDRPVYLQIMDQIQGAVMSGELASGQRVPSVRDLATAARVNPNTMQHALQELERMQLLVTNGTSGRYVTEDPQILDSIRTNKLRALAQDCLSRFASYGYTPSQAATLLLEFEERND